MLLLCGCGGAGPTPGEPAAGGGTLLVALPGDVDSWNPYTTHDATSAALLDLLYPRLVLERGGEDGNTQFEPWLAESWQFSADRLSLTFRLRPTARWSDGSPITCADVRFTHGVQTADELAWAGAFIKSRIAAVECADEHTAVYRFVESYAGQLLDANDNAIVPSAYGEIPLGDWAATDWPSRMIGCGPFRLAENRPGQEAILERDPGWWDAAAVQPDRVVFRVYPEVSGALPRLLDGEVDLLAKLPPMRAGAVEASPRLRLVRLPSLAYSYIGWNTLQPGAYSEDRRRRGCDEPAGCVETAADLQRLRAERPHAALDDARVRRALALAIDRQDLVDGIWSGYARAGRSPVLSSLWAHEPRTALPYDPAAAAELLDAAGWRDEDGDRIREREGRPLQLEVIVNAGNRPRRDALERISVGFERIGVRLIEVALPRREFVSRARNKNFDAVLSGWWAGTRVELNNLLHSEAAINRGNNLGSWSTPGSDELLERAMAAPTREQAARLWSKWQLHYRDEQPITVLYEEQQLIGLSVRVQPHRWSFLNPYQHLHEMRIEPRPGATR